MHEVYNFCCRHHIVLPLTSARSYGRSAAAASNSSHDQSHVLAQCVRNLFDEMERSTSEKPVTPMMLLTVRCPEMPSITVMHIFDHVSMCIFTTLPYIYVCFSLDASCSKSAKPFLNSPSALRAAATRSRTPTSSTDSSCTRCCPSSRT